MTRSVTLLAATALGGIVFVAGCGTTVRPHVRLGGGNQPTTSRPDAPLSPRPDLQRGDSVNARPVVDQICRAQPMPSGWIAIRYVPGDENCPASTDPRNPYTATVIERYSHRPIGSTMVVCADQPVPREWVRADGRNVQDACDGARVPDGAPTVMRIQRVSGA